MWVIFEFYPMGVKLSKAYQKYEQIDNILNLNIRENRTTDSRVIKEESTGIFQKGGTSLATSDMVDG